MEMTTSMREAFERLTWFQDNPSEDTFQGAMAAMDKLREDYNAIREEWNQLAIAFVEDRGSVTLGESRYYVGTARAYKPRVAPGAMLQTLLASLGGDVDAVADTLASGCWKPGTIRNLIDDDATFDGLFETVERPDLKTGKPKRELKRAPVGAQEGVE